MDELDPRWEWFEVTMLGDPGPRYIKGRCRHLETEPVNLLTGEIVGHLCTTCDTLLEIG